MRPSAGSFDLDTCLLIHLFHNDSGYAAAETWLVEAETAELWISHWLLLEFASATALRCRRGDMVGRVEVVQAALTLLGRKRLGIPEPRGDDVCQARSGLEGDASLGLRAADALHLPLALRRGLMLISAEQALVGAAPQRTTSRRGPIRITGTTSPSRTLPAPIAGWPPAQADCPP